MTLPLFWPKSRNGFVVFCYGGAPGGALRRSTMSRIVAVGLTALFVTASPLAYAQTAASAATPSAADWNTLTDMRIDVVKAALKLTPDQEKYWPAIEGAIRDRAKNHQARFAEIEKRVGELREGN